MEVLIQFFTKTFLTMIASKVLSMVIAILLLVGIFIYYKYQTDPNSLKGMFDVLKKIAGI
jgi:hypothetical protein